MNICQEIHALLPYKQPFLFVDELLEIKEDEVKGTYRYPADSYFYEGHFPGNPITPGVILIETMAQIGLVSLGMFLTEAYKTKKALPFAFTSSEVEFYHKVLPGEQVIVSAKKVYFRLGKLKCNVIMNNLAGTKVCKGTLSGMVLKTENQS